MLSNLYKSISGNLNFVMYTDYCKVTAPFPMKRILKITKVAYITSYHNIF